ncbi:hypothetical protein OF83DRAFT_1134431 [Amylostereum chailletii]|nr:hypothetical protein OF83DRAFT_1134431 [Amylostereum chailletii]
MADENAGFLPLPGGAPAQPALQAPFASMENYLEAREYQTMVSALNDLPDDHPHYLSNNEVRKAEVIAGQVLNVTSLPGFENPNVQLIANENPGVQHVLDILNARFDNLENNMNNRLDILTQLTAQNTKDSAVVCFCFTPTLYH